MIAQAQAYVNQASLAVEKCLYWSLIYANTSDKITYKYIIVLSTNNSIKSLCYTS
jgi:hypothetical protein